MWQIALSCLISLGMILGAQNYSSEHTKEQIKLGASQSISSLTELTSLSHNDVFPITDTANAQTKKLKWGTATATLKTLFDTKYTALFTDSAGLASLLSDETGSSGGFVRAGSPTLTSATLSGVTITTASITAATSTNSFSNILAALTARFGATATSSFSSTGALTLATPLTIANGGTGQTTAQAAIDALLPSQGSNSGKFLTTNGTNASWSAAGARCFVSSYSSTSWTSINSYTETQTFPNPLGATPNVFRITYNSSDPNTTKSGSWGSGVATTTGTAAGAYTTSYVEGAGAVFNGHSASNTVFMQTYQHNGSSDQAFVSAYINSANSSQTVVTLTAGTMEAVGSKLFFTLEQCI